MAAIGLRDADHSLGCGADILLGRLDWALVETILFSGPQGGITSLLITEQMRLPLASTYQGPCTFNKFNHVAGSGAMLTSPWWNGD